MSIIKYGVQILDKHGKWTWAGVDVPAGSKYGAANREKLKMARDPYWEKMGAKAFRVRAIPGTGEQPKGTRARAREAEAYAAELAKRVDALVLERDEAREVVADFASRLGLEVEW